MIQQDIYMAGKRLGDLPRQRIASIAGGYTVLSAHGGWVSPEGKLFTEASYVVRVLVHTEQAAAEVIEECERWARYVGEESIMVTRQVIEVEFVKI